MSYRILAAFAAAFALVSSVAVAQSPQPSPQSSTQASPQPPPATATPAGTPVPQSSPGGTYRKTLANGLQIVVVEDHSAAVVQTAMWYRFGSLLETKGKTGLAHGLEHMMFRGTPSISSGGLDDISSRLGAQENANTSEDYTHFYFVMPSDKLDLALHIEADRMTNLTLSEADWKLEKGAVLSEYEGDFSQPLFKLSQAVRDKAYPNSPYALTALGVRADIVRSTAADLRTYYRQWYHPNNATLVVTGDVHADDVFARAEKYFGPIPSVPLPNQQVPDQPEDVHNGTATVNADYPYQVLDVAYYVPGDIQKDTAAPAVLSEAMSSERSPFYRALVLSNIALSYQFYTDTSLKGGLFHALVTVAPGHTVEQARSAYEQTLKSIQTQGIAPDLVAAAKTSVVTQAIYARDAISGLGDRYGYATGVEQEPGPEVDDAKVAALSVADVDAAAKSYLAQPAVVGTLIPQRPKPGAGGKGNSGSGVSDNFSNRAPNGPIHEAPWVKAALATPPRVESKVKPAAFTLSNGIRVYVQEVHTNPTVFMSGNVEQSPAFDPRGKEGTGELASEMESYGSAKYDFETQRKILDDLGATADVGSAFGVHCLSKDFDKLLDLVADAAIHPTYPQQYLTLLKRQQIATISRRNANPDYLAQRAFAQLLLSPADPSLRQTSIPSVSAITDADLRSYARRYFRPDLTTIQIAGDVTPAQARAKLEAAFGSWHASGPKPNTALPPYPKPHAATKFILADRVSDTVIMGQPGIRRQNPDFYPMLLMNEILGGGGAFDTRLMNEIRVKRGLVYSVSSSLDVNRYRGSVNFFFTANPKNVAAAARVLKAQIVRIQHQPVSAEELTRAKSRLIAGTLVGEEATSALLGRIANIATFHLPLDYYQQFASRYNAITAADVQRVARRYLHPQALVEVFEGPRY